MSLSRITTRFSRTFLTQSGRNSVFLFRRHGSKHFQSSSNYLISSRRINDMVVPVQVSSLHHSALSSSAFQWFGFSSSASPETNEKEAAAQSGNEKEHKESNEAAAEAPSETEESISDDKSESDLESELSRDDLVKLVVEKEQLLAKKHEELEQMKDKVLRSFAEMENVKDRTRRESENTKKFAIQNFAKSLLDVADNLGRASSAAKGSFSKIHASTDAAGAVQQLKTLLEGVEMTEKQLTEVFKKFGLEKYDPTNEEFDPNRHNAVFQVPDASKPAGHVSVVLKAGYVLHDRVIRPAEVGVTVAVDNEEAEKGSDA
ncbi:Co-chaperone GrpE family protein [Perilla frutescens var. hirtella]|uniref:GrpE protein homolog n=1 Tax=Perilla frutescens var. hirtella TaxID=608512 RepID=A0AAD4JKU6_PERFH|nr:Co-chaperone GrpE family protein [Perilla frutescens var. hirtella]